MAEIRIKDNETLDKSVKIVYNNRNKITATEQQNAKHSFTHRQVLEDVYAGAYFLEVF